MRGQAKEVRTLNISGRSYLEYEDFDKIEKPSTGDITFFLVLESNATDPAKVYDKKGYKGYYKCKIFDGKEWCHIDCSEIFTEKEHHFSKNEITIYTYNLCKQIIAEFSGTILYRSYRSHYTTIMPVREGYKGRKDKFNSK